MSPDTVPDCTEQWSVTALNEWRDGVLDPAQAQGLDRHLGGCAACQGRLGEYAELATALRSIPMAEPVHGYGQDPRPRALAPAGQQGHPQRHAQGHASHRARLRLAGGLGAVAAVLLVALGFTQLFAVLGHRSGSGPVVHAPPVPTATATPVPTIGPGQFTAVVSLQEAWGSHAVSAQVNAVLDAKHEFMPESVTPDGRQVIGSLYALGAAADTVQAGLLDVATRQFTPIGNALPYSPITGVGADASCRASDERYVVCVTQADTSASAPNVATLWSYDRVSKRARVITDTHRYAFAELGQMFASHGTLVFMTGERAYQVDLTTNAITPVPLPSQGPQVTGFSWPYLVYLDQPSNWQQFSPTQLPKVRAHNLVTGQDIALPQVDALYAPSTTEDSPGFEYPVLTGDTLFMGLVTGRIASTNFPPNNVTDATLTLFELDYLFDAGAHPRPVARYHFTVYAGGVGSANTRLVDFGFGAWDRAEDRLVMYSSLPEPKGPAGFLNGNILWTYDNYNQNSSQEITLYDTSRLPIAGG